MSVLEKIRSKTGLLVGIIGLALVIFILESLLGSGSAFFTSNDNVVGVIDGDKIDTREFSTKMDEQIALASKNNPNMVIDDRLKEQVSESVWNQMINDRVIKTQYKKLGIAVSDDELYDLMLVHPHQYVIQQFTDQQTGRINEQFANPDGSFNITKLNQLVAAMPADQEKAWKQLEKQILEVRIAEKYNALIKKGLYVTTAEAKDAFTAQNKQVDASFVMKRYISVPDSTVKVSDDDISSYYKKHQNEYKVSESTRKIEYIAYDVMPSKADYDTLQKEAQSIANRFREITAEDDSSYIAQESDNGQVNIASYSKKTMVIPDSSVFNAPKGTVFGPYTEGTFLKIYKLSDIKSVADSAKVRHILIGLQSPKQKEPRTPDAAKRMADSLLVLIKDKKVSFDTLVKTVSDDLGSVEKGGDYGWFDENKGFVDPFKNAGLQGTVGNISIVPTQFGYHIIEVLNVSKTRHNSYKVAQISRLIAPSAETTNEYFTKASVFAGNNATNDLFNKSVEAEKMNKRIADNMKENDKEIRGLEGESVKELVRWSYKAKKGDVSEVFTFKNRFIVAHLVGVKDRGILPLEEVKDEVTLKVIRDKKAENFISEFNSKAGASKSIDDIASKMGLLVEKADKLTFSSFNVAAIGREDAFIGTATAMKSGTTSKAVKGDNGVFIVNVTAVNEPVMPKDFKNKQKEIEQTTGGRVDYELYDALKDKANIEDHRGKFY